MQLKQTIAIHNEDEWVVATCLENNVASQGKNMDEALANLKEALELYYEEVPEIPFYPQVYVTAMEIAV
jgi:predicted RNase H-like HicB family nuclease